MPTWRDIAEGSHAEYLGDLRSLSQPWVVRTIPIDFGRGVVGLEADFSDYSPAGLKIHPLQGFPLDETTLRPFFEFARGHHLWIYCHTDWLPSTEYKQAGPILAATFGKLARWFPDNVLIMGHCGNNDSYINVWQHFKRNPRVYGETSMAPTTAELEKVITKVGAERLLFGTNAPHCAPRVEIQKILSLYQISDEVKKMILHDNAEALLAGEAWQ
jgi:predicted TIM-barrel fold metal-dependent hydrolase